MVNGLATVDMDVELDLFAIHPEGGQLQVTLTNPHGTEVVVPMDGSTRFSGTVLGFSGDEAVNGPWTLRIVDGVAGDEGSLLRWTLHLGSRFD
jgi:subtilisin-like proprotein convertase family protein